MSRFLVTGGSSGIGCAVGTWGGGGNDQCKVDVTISRDGSVVVAVGSMIMVGIMLYKDWPQ